MAGNISTLPAYALLNKKILFRIQMDDKFELLVESKSIDHEWELERSADRALNAKKIDQKEANRAPDFLQAFF